MLAKLTRGNQITIPKEIVRKAHLKEGNDYVDVEYVKGVICLKALDMEERIPAEQYDKLIEWAFRKEKGDISFASPEEAAVYFRKQIKKT